MFEQESIMYYPFRHDTNFKESSLNSTGSTLLDSGTSGRPFASSFSGQSSTTPVFNHGGSIQGFSNVQGSYNIPSSLSSRNAGLGGSSSGVHQPVGGLPSGRYASSNLPIGLSQLSQSGIHGHNSIGNRAGLNVVGNHPLSSGMNGAGVSGPGMSPNTVTLGNRGSMAGLGGVQMGAGSGPRVQGSVGNMPGGGGAGGNLNRTLSSGGGLAVPSLSSSRMNLGPMQSGGGGLGGGPASGRAMSPMLQQSVNTTYSPSGDLLAMISRAVPPQVVSLLGGSNFSTTSGSGMQGQLGSANGQLGNLGLGSDGNQSDGAAFDINDFPVLSNRQGAGGGLQGPLAAFRKQGVNSLGQQNQEFSIQNEDFPALPGFKGGNGELTSEMHHKDRQHENSMSVMQQQHFGMGRSGGFPLGVSFVARQQQQQSQQQQQQGSSTSGPDSNLSHLQESYHSSHGLPASYQMQPGATGSQVSLGLRSGSPAVVGSGGLGSYDLIHQYEHHQQQQPHFRLGAHPQQQQQQLAAALGQQQQQQSQQPPPRSSPSSASAAPGSSSPSSAAPPSSLQDSFGLLGLLSVIRMTEPDLTTLALGTDLTTLGLNLNSRENLYKTFASPWAEGPVKGDPEYALPPCYIQQQAPRLQPGNFGRLPQEVLFYIFYSMPKDEAQLYAAHELSNRGWFFHKAQQMWLMRVPNVEPLVKTNTFERGSYIFFDQNVWETTRKENFVLHYEMVEKPPQLPPAAQS